jgi:hypothetical protein
MNELNTAGLVVIDNQGGTASGDGGGHNLADSRKAGACAVNQFEGRSCSDSQRITALDGDDGQYAGDSQSGAAIVADPLVDSIVEVYRHRTWQLRAEMKLTLQAKAVCRSLCAGDKDEADKLYAAVTTDKPHPLADIARGATMYMLQARNVLTAPREAYEKRLEALAKQLPVADWCKETKGLGFMTLAKIVGEAKDAPGTYRSPACLWARFGMGVLGDGTRQRKIAGDGALELPYSPTRRSLMYLAGDGLLKAQVRAVKDEKGKPTGERVAIGPYGQLYIDRRTYEEARECKPMVAHMRAKRYIEKRLLRELWRAWRAAKRASTSKGVPPLAEVSDATESTAAPEAVTSRRGKRGHREVDTQAGDAPLPLPSSRGQQQGDDRPRRAPAGGADETIHDAAPKPWPSRRAALILEPAE